MSNEETLQEYNTRLAENNTSLGNILTTINNLSTSDSGSTSNNYSTEEQVVGTWIDGKPLYRKTIYITNLSTQQSYGISNVDVIYVDYGHSFVSWDLNTLVYTPQRANFTINKTQGIIWGETSGLSDWKGYITLEYTKTTD